MTYILTSLLMVCGILFHVMQKIRALRTKFPSCNPNQVVKTFFAEEWDSLFVSLVVWLVYEIFIYISILNNYSLPMWYKLYGVYGLALVLGYSGQRLAYKYLGTAEKVLEKKAEQIENNKP